MPLPRNLPKRFPSLKGGLASMATISFSLTFVAVSMALLLGFLPTSVSVLQRSVDVGVVLLLVPLCALTFAILGEVMIAAFRGLPRVRRPIDAPALSGWRPGHGEG